MTLEAYLLVTAVSLVAAVFLAAQAFGRRWAPAAFCLITIAFAAGLIDTLGRPKPVDLEWRTAEEAMMLAQVPSATGTVVLLALDGSVRCYEYAGEETRKKLQQAERDGRRIMRRPFDHPEMKPVTARMPDK